MFFYLKRSLNSAMHVLTKLILVFSFLFSGSTLHASYEEGEEANSRGEREVAFGLFEEAAQAGDVRAYTRLGSMYLYGLGTERNFVEAYYWFALGADSGDKYAEAFRKTASGSMTPAQVEEAEKRLEEKRSTMKVEKAQ